MTITLFSMKKQFYEQTFVKNFSFNKIIKVLRENHKMWQFGFPLASS